MDKVSEYSEEHRKRRELFDKYWNYYRGFHKKHLKIREGSPDDNVVVNLSRKVVDTGATFLFGKSVTFSTDGDEGTETPEEVYLRQVFAPDPINNFHYDDFLNELAIYGGITGTAFARLYNTGDMFTDKPSVVAINPAMVDVVTDPDNVRDVIEYLIIWKGGDDWKRDRITRVDNGTWEIAREIKTGAGSRWVLDGDVLSWPYQWPTMFHCQNIKNPLSFWGDSDLTDADLNDSINFIASNTNRIIKFHAHPKTVAVGVSKDQIQATAVDSLWAVPNPEARVENLEMQSDLASSMAHLDRLKNDFYQVTGLPDLSPDKVQIGALSGFALSILYAPLLSKTEGKRRRYGSMLQRINAAVLELGNFGEGIVTDIDWPNPLPSDKTERAQLFGEYAQHTSIEAAARISGHSKDDAQMLAAVDIPPMER